MDSDDDMEDVLLELDDDDDDIDMDDIRLFDTADLESAVDNTSRPNTQLTEIGSVYSTAQDVNSIKKEKEMSEYQLKGGVDVSPTSSMVVKQEPESLDAIQRRNSQVKRVEEISSLLDFIFEKREAMNATDSMNTTEPMNATVQSSSQEEVPETSIVIVKTESLSLGTAEHMDRMSESLSLDTTVDRMSESLSLDTTVDRMSESHEHVNVQEVAIVSGIVVKCEAISRDVTNQPPDVSESNIPSSQSVVASTETSGSNLPRTVHDLVSRTTSVISFTENIVTNKESLDVGDSHNTQQPLEQEKNKQRRKSDLVSKEEILSGRRKSRVILTDIKDQLTPDQAKILSDLADIKLAKPRERRSPRKDKVTVVETVESAPLSPDVEMGSDDNDSDYVANSDHDSSKDGAERPRRTGQKTGNKHGCYLCDVGFNAMANLQTHLRSVHSYYSSAKDLGCTHCGTLFHSPTAVIQHERNIHSLHMACSFCGKGHPNKEALQIHVCNHLQPLTYLCMLCREDFPNVTEAEKHLGKHKGEVAFWSDFLKCRFCGSLFSKREKLFNHVMKVHDDLFLIKCKSCRQPFYLDSALSVHRSDHKQKLDGKKIRVSENIQIKFDMASQKVSKNLIDISEDGSFESHNEACALKLNNKQNNKTVNVEEKSHLDMMYNLGKPAEAKSSGDTAPKEPPTLPDIVVDGAKLVPKNKVMSQMLTSKPGEQRSDSSTGKEGTTVMNESLENLFQRIMFRTASNIQELLKLSLTIEGHVTPQSHQFLAKVYDQKFKVVMALWSELQNLAEAVNKTLCSPGCKLSRELVDALLCGVLKDVHTLRKNKMDTVAYLGKYILQLFDELNIIVVKGGTILTAGLQRIAVEHYDHWLEFLPNVMDSQWNVFKDIATNHSDNSNQQVMEYLGKLWQARVTFNEKVTDKKSEVLKLKAYLKPPAEIEGKNRLFKLSNDTAVFVEDETDPIAISAVKPGTKIMIPVTKLPEKMGNAQRVNMLEGTQTSAEARDLSSDMPSNVLRLPGVLVPKQPKDYCLAYISQNYIQERGNDTNTTPVPSTKPTEPIKIDNDIDEDGNSKDADNGGKGTDEGVKDKDDRGTGAEKGGKGADKGGKGADKGGKGADKGGKDADTDGINDEDGHDDDGGIENTEDNREDSDVETNNKSDDKTKQSATDGEELLMDCTEDIPVNINNRGKSSKEKKSAPRVEIVRDSETGDMDMDCVTIKPEPLDYSDTTVDLCLTDDEDDDNDDEKVGKDKEKTDGKKKGTDKKKGDSASVVIHNSENDEEIRVVLADAGADIQTSTEKDAADLQTNAASSADQRPGPGGDTAVLPPPNKKLKLVQIFHGAPFQDSESSDATLEEETTLPLQARIKSELIANVIARTTVGVKTEPINPCYSDGTPSVAMATPPTGVAMATPPPVTPPRVKQEPVDTAVPNTGTAASSGGSSDGPNTQITNEVIKSRLRTKIKQERRNGDTDKPALDGQSDSDLLKEYYA